MSTRNKGRGLWRGLITVLLAGSVAAAVLMLVLGEFRRVISKPGLASLDRGLMSAVHSWSSPWLTHAMFGFSLIGSWGFVIPSAVLLFLYLFFKGAKREAVILAVAVGASAALNLWLKLWFYRVRPAVPWTLTHEASFSFPSGHAVSAFCFYATLTYLFVQGKQKWSNAVLIVASLFMISGIGLSRVYLGVHYPSDIAAGYLEGAVWVAVVIFATQPRGTVGRRNTAHIQWKIRALDRRFREAQMIARALKSSRHPILVQIIAMRRCNLSCAYCNEYDSVSEPVSTDLVLRRLELLAALGTSVVTVSGGEPLLHPDLDEIVRGIRSRGMLAELITNGYLLTPGRIHRLNSAGLDHLQISIDNVMPDEVSKKSLKVLDRKLQWLAQHAQFDVNINSVLGSSVRDPEDAVSITRRARELGFESTVGLIHDGSGQLRTLDYRREAVYDALVKLPKPFYTSALYARFYKNLVRGSPNDWHCRAGSRYLYICEDGLVHYCSQQRGYPGIPLDRYTRENLEREYHTIKPCAPYCTIPCVQRVAMVDEFRESPKEALRRFFPPQRIQDTSCALPWSLRVLTWLFMAPNNSWRRPLATTFSRAALWTLRVK